MRINVPGVGGIGLHSWRADAWKVTSELTKRKIGMSIVWKKYLAAIISSGHNKHD